MNTMNTDNIILPILYRIGTLNKKNEYVVFLQKVYILLS
jgi:hypothetical protein